MRSFRKLRVYQRSIAPSSRISFTTLHNRSLAILPRQLALDTMRVMRPAKMT